jgi:hypothetical protein
MATSWPFDFYEESCSNMPTIDQLASATAASDTDEFMVSQSGIVRSITRAQVLAGVQPQLSVSSGTLLGGSSTGNGSPEQVTVGANLMLASGTLSAAASPYIMSALAAGTVPSATDSVPIGQGGTNVVVTYAQFLSGLPGVPNIDSSQLLVTGTGSTTQQRLAEFVASALPRAGGTLTGLLGLVGDPSSALHAATKEYVDTRVFRSGDTMTGLLILSADPTVALGATTKEYTDGQFGKSLPAAGGTMTGPLTLAADPTTTLQAASKQYVDGRVASSLPLTGGILSGILRLSIYIVACLPSATVGALAYATNGRKPGEATGFGTGVLIVGEGDGQWVSVMSGTTVLS